MSSSRRGQRRLRAGLLLAMLLGLGFALPARAQQPAPELPIETRRYDIEVAGLRVGTLVATRQPLPGGEVRLTQVSDVRVNFLIYHLVVYYKVVNRVRDGQLLLSTVEARTNQGNFSSRTEWLGDHYAIQAHQYKHHYQGTETRPIRYTTTDMFFGAPAAGSATAYSEYFGQYFGLRPGPAASFDATLNQRTDTYHYQQGQLTSIIKHNPLKNFIVRYRPGTSANGMK